MMIVMMMMMIMMMVRMLWKTLAPCLDLLKAPCLDFLEAPCLLPFKKLMFLMMTALWWMIS